VRRAAEGGDISVSAVRVLASAREVSPEAFARDEATLLEAASIHGARDLTRVTAHWKRMAESVSNGAGTASGSGGGSSPHRPWEAWCGWTATSTPIRVRPSSQPYRRDAEAKSRTDEDL
jgi:hypothetical protein